MRSGFVEIFVSASYLNAFRGSVKEVKIIFMRTMKTITYHVNRLEFITTFNDIIETMASTATKIN